MRKINIKLVTTEINAPETSSTETVSATSRGQHQQVVAAGTSAAEAEKITPKDSQNNPESPNQTMPNPIFKEAEDEIRKCHAQIGNSSLEVLIAAAKCGVLLIVYKVIAGHGGFEKWFAQAHFDFCKMTRSNYMRFAEKLQQIAKSKTVLLLDTTVDDDGKLTAYSFHEEELRRLMTEESNGRSLTEMYAAWGITKHESIARTSASKAQPKATAFDRWVATLDGIPTIFESLPTDVQTTLISKLEQVLQTLKETKPNEQVK